MRRRYVESRRVSLQGETLLSPNFSQASLARGNVLGTFRNIAGSSLVHHDAYFSGDERWCNQEG